MPIFKFENDWRDWRYDPAENGEEKESSSSSPSPEDSNPAGSAPVVSGYFWIYFAFSIGLTFLTIEGWWRFAGQSQSPKPELPHWMLYPVWWIYSYLR